MTVRSVSAYIPTGGASVTRNIELLKWPITARPQSLSLYVRFIELGTIRAPDNAKVVVMGSSGNDTFQIDMDIDPNPHYRVSASNGSVISSVAFSTDSTPALGDVVEIVGRWHTNGSVTAIQVINNGTPTTTAQSGALVRTPTFTQPNIQFGGYGTNPSPPSQGYIGIREVAVLRGVHGLETMRRVAGADKK